MQGKHAFRFGGEVRRDQFNQAGNEFSRGSFNFDIKATQYPSNRTHGDAFADFLLGRITLSQAAVSVAEARFRANSFALYFDDTWKVTPRLTLTLNAASFFYVKHSTSVMFECGAGW